MTAQIMGIFTLVIIGGWVLWQVSPLLVLIPLGIIGLLVFGIITFLVVVAEFRSWADWDFLIRSVLHRLGFAVAPPEHLADDLDEHDHQH